MATIPAKKNSIPETTKLATDSNFLSQVKDPLGFCMLAGLVIAVFLLTITPIMDLDVWWHVAIGRLHVEEGRFPSTDPFSHTAANLPWDNKEWLFGIGAYLLSKAFGLTSLTIAKGIVVTVTFVWLYFLLLEFSEHRFLCALLTIIGARASRLCFTERPWLFTFLFVIVYIFILHKYHQKKGRWWISLPLIMILWVNLHPAAGVGIFIILAYLVKSAWPDLQHKMAGKPDTLWSHSTKILSLTILLCLIAICINPIHVHRLLSPFQLFTTHSVYISSLNETEPPSIRGNPFFFGLFAVTLILVSLYFAGIGIEQWLLLVGFSVLALLWRRNIPMFVGAVLPLTTMLLDKLLYGKKYLDVALTLKRNKVGLELMTITILGAVAFFVGSQDICTLGIMGGMFPVQACQFLEESGIQGNMYNIYDWGGYLVYRLYPQFKVFVDGRVPDAFTPKIWADYQAIQRGKPEYEQLLEQYDCKICFLSTSDLLRNLIQKLEGNPKWIRIFPPRGAEITNVLLYVKDEAPNGRIIGELRHTEMAMAAWQQKKFDVVVKEFNKVLEYNPDNIQAYFHLGLVYGHELKEYPKALEMFQRVIEINPASVDAYNNMAVVYDLMGNPQKAVEVLEKALSIQPQAQLLYENLNALKAKVGQE